MFRIVYSKGEILIQVSPAAGSFEARLIDNNNSIDVIFVEKSENDLHDKCRCWASSNIRGEFSLEPLLAARSAEAAA